MSLMSGSPFITCLINDKFPKIVISRMTFFFQTEFLQRIVLVLLFYLYLIYLVVAINNELSNKLKYNNIKKDFKLANCL